VARLGSQGGRVVLQPGVGPVTGDQDLSGNAATRWAVVGCPAGIQPPTRYAVAGAKLGNAKSLLGGRCGHFDTSLLPFQTQKTTTPFSVLFAVPVTFRLSRIIPVFGRAFSRVPRPGSGAPRFSPKRSTPYPICYHIHVVICQVCSCHVPTRRQHHKPENTPHRVWA